MLMLIIGPGHQQDNSREVTYEKSKLLRVCRNRRKATKFIIPFGDALKVGGALRAAIVERRPTLSHNMRRDYEKITIFVQTSYVHLSPTKFQNRSNFVHSRKPPHPQLRDSNENKGGWNRSPTGDQKSVV